MSAGRNASFILTGLIATCLLFGIFTGISHLGVLQKHAYAMEVGWQTVEPATPPPGECDRQLVTRGFPLTTRRPASSEEDATGCLDDTNPLANAMNYAIYFALACIVGAGVAEAARNRL
jgi:hypothetical protein